MEIANRLPAYCSFQAQNVAPLIPAFRLTRVFKHDVAVWPSDCAPRELGITFNPSHDIELGASVEKILPYAARTGNRRARAVPAPQMLTALPIG